MTTFAKPTSKGQVTIRKALIEHMKLRPGQRLEMRPTPDGNVLLVPEQPKHDISAIFGLLKRPGERALTIEEINDGIAQGAVDSYLRSIGQKPEDDEEAA